MLEHVKEVIIMFKSGDINKPVYIGAVNNPELYQVRMDIATGGGVYNRLINNYQMKMVT